MTTWIILRAAGIGAYLMLFLSVAWGLVATTGTLSKRVSKASATVVHQFMSTTGLLLLAVHIGLLLVDSFMPFHPLDLLIPMRSTFKPVAVAFGIIAMYAMVMVLVTSWTKKYMGTKWWRRLHLASAPTFTLALAHGIFAGTDTVRPWMWWMYVVTGTVVLFLVAVRGLTAGFRPERAPRPAHATRAAAPARASQAAPVVEENEAEEREKVPA